MNTKTLLEPFDNIVLSLYLSFKPYSVMKFIRHILSLIIALLFIVPFTGCATKKRVLVIECPTYKPSELNKEGFKTENKRNKSLDKENKNLQKERN